MYLFGVEVAASKSPESVLADAERLTIVAKGAVRPICDLRGKN